MRRTYKFLNGYRFDVEGEICRGCYMQNNAKEFPDILQPVLQNKDIAIRQDAEFPVPGFYIISLKKHVNSLADVDFTLASQLGTCIHLVRKALKECMGVTRAHIYLEEKSYDPHYHTWVLPIWDSTKMKFNIEPRIWENNIKAYLELFEYESEKEQIIKFNKMLKEYLIDHTFMKELDFR